MGEAVMMTGACVGLLEGSVDGIMEGESVFLVFILILFCCSHRLL